MPMPQQLKERLHIRTTTRPSEVSACIGRQAEGRRRLSPVTARSPASLAAGLCWLALYWRASLVVGAPGCRISWYFYSVEL